MSKSRLKNYVARTALGLAPGFAAALNFAAPVIAQENEGTRKLETVTVTAQKREQTLQDVPVAVSVVGEKVLEQAQILDIQDLQTVVPSLRVNQLQSTTQTNFVIRGFGNGANNAGIEPSVGVFVDGVFRSRIAGSINDLPNLERVEVLRGPQSTLFGKNASAGVINIVTQAPQFEFGGSAEVTYGNFDQLIFKGDVTGPISDNVAFSLSGSRNTRDGYATNTFNGDELNERNRWNIRGQLLFEFSDEARLRVIGDWNELDENCCVTSAIENGAASLAIIGIGGELGDPTDPFSYEVPYDLTPTSGLTDRGISGQFDYDFENFSVTSISSFRQNNNDNEIDADFSSAAILNNNNDTEIETFTQEIRLASTWDERFDWLVGGFYFNEQIEIQSGLDSGVQTRPFVDGLAGGPAVLGTFEQIFMLEPGTFFGPDTGSTEFFTSDNDSFSFFGQLDFYLTDKLTVTGGLNYTNDQKEFTGTADINYPFSAIDLTTGAGAFGVDLLTAAAFPGVFEAETGLPATPENQALVGQATVDAILAGTEAATLAALQGLQFRPPFIDIPNAVEPGETDDEDVSWTARLAYDVNDNINVYFSAATGFKAASVNLSRDANPLPR
ncbi:MAG: TonB-dependent receptor, partial [Pseudomonadota bacterium]